MAPRHPGKAHPQPAGGAPRGDGAGRGAVVAAAGARRAGTPPGQPHQDALEHLHQDARGEQNLRPGDGRVRFPPGDALGAQLLPRAGRGARRVQAAGRALPRFHRHPQGQRLPVAAHGAVRALRLADRGADPHRGDGPDRRARRGRALDLQVRRRFAQQRAEPRARVDRRADRFAALGRFVAGIPGQRQGRPVPGRGLPVHAQGQDPGVAAQLHRARLRLCGAHRHRQPRGGLARGQEAGAAAHQAGQRADGGSDHRALGHAQATMAGVRGQLQGAYRHPPPAQAARARGRRAAGPPHARPRAGSDGQLDRAPAQGAAGCVPGRAPLPAPGSVPGRRRAWQLDAHPGRAGADGAWRAARRRYHAAGAGEDPDQRQRARRGQLRRLLPADPGRRDHGLPHRRQGHRGASHGLPEPG